MYPIKVPEYTSLALRSVQVIFALIAFSCAFGGYKCSIPNNWGRINLGSDSEVHFLGVTNILIFISSGLWIFYIEYLKKPLPHPWVGLINDFIAIVFTFAASIAVGQSYVVLNICSSSYVSDNFLDRCGLKCGAIKASIAFTVFELVLFVATFGLCYLTFQQNCSSNSSDSNDIPYAVTHAEQLTPRTPANVGVKENASSEYVLQETPKVVVLNETSNV